MGTISHFGMPESVDENYVYKSNTPLYRLLMMISNAVADLEAKNILDKAAKMNPDAKKKVKEVRRIASKAVKVIDELSDML